MRGHNIDYDKALRLRKEGMKLTDIASTMGCSYVTMRKHLGADNPHKQIKQPLASPLEVVFDLEVGDEISAYEFDISKGRHTYRVISIGKYLFTGERVHGYPWKVSFLIKDYGRPSDPAHVKKISCIS